MTELLSIAGENDIGVEYANIPLNGSLSIRFDDGSSAVALDYGLERRLSEAKVHAAHEIGHCITGSFYNFYAPLDVRGKHERRADAWAIRQLMPWPEVWEAIRHGYTTAYELAEWFNVTEEFAEKAMRLYN